MVYDSDLVGDISKYFAAAALFCYGVIAAFTALGSDIGMYMPVLLGIGALCLSATICLVSSLIYDYCKEIVSIRYHRCLSSFIFIAIDVILISIISYFTLINIDYFDLDKFNIRFLRAVGVVVLVIILIIAVCKSIDEIDIIMSNKLYKARQERDEKKSNIVNKDIERLE
jgi:hypothetical protein